jgi:16S rRNA (guanine527-N7)-methyltransferase
MPRNADKWSLPSPAYLRQKLAAACVDLGLDADDADMDRLLAYGDSIQKWNKVYNLTAVRSSLEILNLHLIDSLAVLPALRRRCRAKVGEGGRVRLLDVGSGAGLPGVVVAILCPEIDVTCVDAVAKKVAFVRQVAAELGLPNLRATHQRVESIAEARFDVITSRAFASLTDFVRLSRPLLAVGSGVWMAMKGQIPDDEIAALAADVDVFHVEQIQVPGLDAKRCLVWMRPRLAALPA